MREHTERKPEIRTADVAPQKWRVIWMMKQRSRAGQMREWEKQENGREKEREIGQWINSPCGLLTVAAGAGLPQGGLARPSSLAIKLTRLQPRIKFSPFTRLLHCSLYKTMSSPTTTTWAPAMLAGPAWSDSPDPDADHIYWSIPSFLFRMGGVGTRGSSSDRNTPYTDVSLFHIREERIVDNSTDRWRHWSAGRLASCHRVAQMLINGNTSVSVSPIGL